MGAGRAWRGVHTSPDSSAAPGVVDIVGDWLKVLEEAPTPYVGEACRSTHHDDLRGAAPIAVFECEWPRGVRARARCARAHAPLRQWSRAGCAARASEPHATQEIVSLYYGRKCAVHRDTISTPFRQLEHILGKVHLGLLSILPKR